MRILALLACLLPLAPLNAAAEVKTIYGEDGRTDFFAVTGQVQRAVMDSAVSMFKSTNTLICFDDVCFFGGVKLGHEARRMCPGEPFYDQPSGASCSGTLIGPDLVLTAGHCMAPKPGKPDACAVGKFVFGYNVAAAGVMPQSVPASEVYSCKATELFAYEGGRDYAVVRLDRPVTGHKPVPVQFAAPAAGSGIFTVGGPYGLPLKVLGGARVRSLNTSAGYMYTDLDSSGGNSGGGVFSAVSGQVVGLHVASYDADLVEIPLPANHGLPATDKRVIEGKCKTAARFEADGGKGKKAVLTTAIEGLPALLGGKSVGAARDVAPVAADLSVPEGRVAEVNGFFGR